jgi:hypothetical protein
MSKKTSWVENKHWDQNNENGKYEWMKKIDVGAPKVCELKNQK